MIDTWREPISGNRLSIDAWNRAWRSLNQFRGDPMADLADANSGDPAFSLGSVFCATYHVLAGSPLDAPALMTEVGRVRERSGDGGARERAHAAAVEPLVRGDFTAAGEAWDEIAATGHDYAAVRFAHDVYLHVGDNDRRLRSSLAAADHWLPEDPDHGFLLGQLSFSLCESGRLAEAEQMGRLALDIDPDDVWARHALAHVYETTDEHTKAIDLLDQPEAAWHGQDLLSTHVWWHLAIRLLAGGEMERAVAIHDQLLPIATTAFRLCDLTSLLWRLELAGVDVGARWGELADRWSQKAEVHTCGFLDLHAAMVFFRQPDHPGAAAFFGGLVASHSEPASEIDRTFREVVRPLVGAFRAYAAGDHSSAVAGFDAIGPEVHRIGGSNAQRDLVPLTRAASAALIEGVSP